MATRNYNTETTSLTSTIKATNHSTETTTSPATTLTTTPGFSPIETITTTNHSTETTTSPATTLTTNNPTTIMPGAYAFIIITYNDGPEYTRRIPLDNYHFDLDISDIEIHPMSVKIEHDRHIFDVNVEYEISGNRITGKLESIMEYNYIRLYSNEYYYSNMSSTTTSMQYYPLLNTTTKKPLHISIGVNYRGFIKYSNITDISNTLSNTTTKISKYIINVGKLGITSTSSTSTLIDIIVPSSTTSPTTTKADAPKPTSIPSINVYSDDGKNYDNGKYLTCEASGVVNETIIVKSLSATLSLAYDNTKFEFSSEYNWYYMKNGKKVEVKANDKHEISLSVLHSTSIYIKVTSTTTSPTNTITEPQKSTPAPSNTSTLLTDSTTSYTTT